MPRIRIKFDLQTLESELVAIEWTIEIELDRD
jgi:hypothetical protein